MKVCFFGTYKKDYARNRVLMTGFVENGYDIVECNVDPKTCSSFGKYVLLVKEYRKIKHMKFDYVIVAFQGHSLVWLARILFGKNIIFDAFVSMYNSEVEDRKKSKVKSLSALRYLFLDWYSCKLSARVLLDTNAHIDYFVNKFHLPKKKFIRVLIGSTTDTFYPKKDEKKDDKFTIHFHGGFIPLQGIEYIVQASKLLESKKDIQFRIVGGGQEYKKIKKLADDLGVINIEWIPRVDISKINNYINNSDVVLGIFGDTSKTQMVIPNKIYEAIACAKPVITAGTGAIEELFIDRENILLCRVSDPKSLADAIMVLHDDNNLKTHIAEDGYDIFKKHALPDVLVKNLLSSLSEK
ncbi:glycosyltransferase [Patescibacteria group bacterium]